MVLVKEYRIINNCTVDEYRIAQLYAVAKMSMNETGGGEGVEVIQNEPYDNEKGKGQYTRKIYSFASRIPAWIRGVAPKGSLELHEEAWNAYPHCLTVLTFPYLGNRFKVVTETMHLADRGETENALNLDADVLALRQVESIDVANDKELSSGAYKEAEDPKLYKAKKTERGPLNAEDWAQTVFAVFHHETTKNLVDKRNQELESKIDFS
ncbi:hypothetical protein GGF44_004436 [Coemansia sp. RSA 1694]|nr:hypothetical protein GGF44_004436 [Coemansia sp. RSA 1694]